LVGAALGAWYYTAPLGLYRLGAHMTPPSEDTMARSCAICGKASMGGFNPQSSGMNRVRAHRRYHPNLQALVVDKAGVPTKTLACTRCRRTLTKSAR
jgi:ribosomal protein L28